MKKTTRFTDKKIKNLPAKDTRYEIRERDGFAIRVSTSGQKTWIFLYDYLGRRRRMTLGTYPYMSLADAREEHGDARKKLRKGIDPAAEKQTKKIERIIAPTIKELANLFLEKWAKPNKRTWKEDERILNKDVIPAWGKRKAANIKRPDVIHLLETIADRGAKIQSNRTLAVIRKMFNIAVGRGILEYSPCTNISPVAKERQKDRVLSETEIKTLWPELDKGAMSEETCRILKLILVTAQRPGEVVSMEWSEVDGNWWTIPANKAKNRQAHRVFLTPLAKELLGSPESGFVFPSPRGDGHIHINALSRAVRRSYEQDKEGNITFSIEHFTPHDLRRTAASLMTGMGISRLVVSKILNHVERGVTAIYDRHSYDNEKRTALEKWSRRLEVILSGKKADKVVSIKKTA